MPPPARPRLLLVASASCARTPKYDRPPRPPLTEAEATEIQRSNGRLCQDAVGFHLDDPGPEFNPRSDLGDNGGNMRMWVWESNRTGERLVIVAIKAMGEMPEGFREWAKGNRAGVAKQAQIEEESVNTDTRPYTATLNARLQQNEAEQGARASKKLSAGAGALHGHRVAGCTMSSCLSARWPAGEPVERPHAEDHCRHRAR
jgi:hypothetical protein